MRGIICEVAYQSDPKDIANFDSACESIPWEAMPEEVSGYNICDSLGPSTIRNAYTTMLPRLAVRALRPPALTLELKSATTLLPLTLVRSYALSRYPERGSRLHRNPKASTITPPPSPPLRLEPASQETVSENELLLERNPDSGGLEKLLANDTLVVVRSASVTLP